MTSRVTEGTPKSVVEHDPWVRLQIYVCDTPVPYLALSGSQGLVGSLLTLGPGPEVEVPPPVLVCGHYRL